MHSAEPGVSWYPEVRAIAERGCGAQGSIGPTCMHARTEYGRRPPADKELDQPSSQALRLLLCAETSMEQIKVRSYVRPQQV